MDRSVSRNFTSEKYFYWGLFAYERSSHTSTHSLIEHTLGVILWSPKSAQVTNIKLCGVEKLSISNSLPFKSKG